MIQSYLYITLTDTEITNLKVRIKTMGSIIGEGITFDDVLLVPQYSEVTPDMITLTTKLTNAITLNIPMMSAAMDTVT